MAASYATAPKKAEMQQPVNEAEGPVETTPAGMPPGQWSSDMFDCLVDPSICWITFFAGCISHGYVLHHLGEPGAIPALIYFLTSPCCLPLCLMDPPRRLKIREKYALPDEPSSGTC